MKKSDSRNTPPICNKFVIVSCLAMLFFLCFLVLFIRGGYPQKIISFVSPTKQITFQPDHADKAVDAWHNCLDQLHIDADIAFIGDSITRRGDFASFFPEKTVCNLGLGSDTIAGITDRISMIESVNPEKVFLLGGINSLRDNTLKQSVAEYENLLLKMNQNDFTEVYIISVLPISSEKSASISCSSETILSFNKKVQSLVKDYNYTYIDLFSLLAADDDTIRPEYTTDGVHLTDSAYQVWIDYIQPFVD